MYDIPTNSKIPFIRHLDPWLSQDDDTVIAGFPMSHLTGATPFPPRRAKMDKLDKMDKIDKDVQFSYPINPKRQALYLGNLFNIHRGRIVGWLTLYMHIHSIRRIMTSNGWLPRLPHDLKKTNFNNREGELR